LPLFLLSLALEVGS